MGILNKKFSFSAKILLVLLTSSIGLTAVTMAISLNQHRASYTHFLQSYRQSLFSDFDALAKSEVETGVSLLQRIYDRSQKGEITLEEAKVQGADLLRSIRYGKDGYLWADTTEGVNVVLLGTPVEGTNRFNKLDAKGKYNIQEILRSGMQPGGGFSDYYTTKKNSKLTLPKRSYSLLFKPFGWVVGTGNYVDDLEALVGKAAAENHKQLMSGIYTNLAVVLVLVILISFLSVFLTRSITLPMLKGVTFARSVASGNLSETIDIRSNDEIGELGGALNAMVESLNTMVESLNTMVLRINGSSNEMSEVTRNIHVASRRVVSGTELQAEGVRETSSAVSEISVSIREVAQGVENLSESAAETSSSTLELAASIEEVAFNMESLASSAEEVSSSIIEMTTAVKQIGASVEILMGNTTSTASSVQEMDSSIKEVERNATSAAAISNDVLRDAETGRESVRAAIVGMEDIRRSSITTAEKINSLSVKTSDIGAILSVIDEVADQTNLLALNAAIIAAQAGENGKGFSVVAGEIKDLADRTKTSTRMISEVIKGVQVETDEAVSAIRATEGSIAEGVVLSRRSGDALDKIVAGVQISASGMNEIARATVEQAKGSQMINATMDQVSEMVAQIRSATREQTKGSEMIMKAVERMKALNSEVRSSTREQSKTGKLIANSTESVTDMIAQIRRACGEQVGFSQRIVHAVTNIEESTGVNLQAASVLEESVSRLSGQVDLLQREMEVFQTKEAGAAALPFVAVVPRSRRLA